MDLIERVIVERRRVIVRPSRSLRRYFPADFFAEYDEPVDLRQTPLSIASLPFLWNMAPIVWATDETYRMDVLEPAVVRSMDAVRDVVRDMYPSLRWHGRIEARSTVATPPPAPSEFDRALLFSGGLDSTYSAMRHSGPGLLLISVWGADIPLSSKRRWAQVEEDNRQFAEANAAGLAVVRSNFRSINQPRLNTLTSEIRNWWADVQFSMALSGLTAPLLHSNGIPVLHVASGYSTAFQGSHGSLPHLDNLISLGHAGVHHDGAELTRQQKLLAIVEGSTQGSPTQLRVCYQNRRNVDRNCGECPKCLRTMVGLVVAGADPAIYGFPEYTPRTLSAIPPRFAAHGVHFNEADMVMWQDIQAHVPAGHHREPFLAWLQDMDFRHYFQAQKDDPRRRARINRLATQMSRLYSVARRAKRRIG
ncbi:MAG: hypothetical protein WD830_03545 [Chloroflexota bacterium]